MQSQDKPIQITLKKRRYLKGIVKLQLFADGQITPYYISYSKESNKSLGFALNDELFAYEIFHPGLLGKRFAKFIRFRDQSLAKYYLIEKYFQDLENGPDVPPYVKRKNCCVERIYIE